MENSKLHSISYRQGKDKSAGDTVFKEMFTLKFLLRVFS